MFGDLKSFRVLFIIVSESLFYLARKKKEQKTLEDVQGEGFPHNIFFGNIRLTAGFLEGFLECKATLWRHQHTVKHIV